MQKDMEPITEPQQFLKWMEENDVLIDLSAADAALLFRYMAEHSYGVAVTAEGRLMRVDLSSDPVKAETYSVDDLIDQVCEWNYEMILDADMRRKNPDNAADFSKAQSCYEAYMLDEQKLDRMFEQTKYAAEIDRIAHRLAEMVLAQMTLDPQKAAAAVAEGIRKYKEVRAR